MGLRIKGSHIKSWFQYRCERKFIYSCSTQEERDALPIETMPPRAVWADYGNEYEEDLIRQLADTQEHGVLQPVGGEKYLTEQASLAYLRGKLEPQYAHQIQVHETAAAHQILRLPDGVKLTRGYLDLVRREEDEDGLPVFTIADIKATQVATLFHKTQVAYYAILLRALLQHNEIPGKISGQGEIWHRPPPGVAGDKEITVFPLASYEGVVRDFFHRELPRFADRTFKRGADRTRFHVYFKCEQCDYLKHCNKSVAPGLAPENTDVSAVAGMTFAAKQSLRDSGIRSVAALAASEGVLSQGQALPWRLKTSGADYVERAKALTSGYVRRLPGRVSLQMPPRTDVQIYLVADRDPMQGRLATLGCRIVAGGEVVTTVTVHRSTEDELDGLRTILGMVGAVLARTDAHNRNLDAGSEPGRILHIYVYEPVEAADIAQALSVHLSSAEVRIGLRELLRIFPPEEISLADQELLAEPEYRGFHHLPASALRSVLQQTHAVPARVSYDLTRVSEALACADAPLGTPYRPTARFRRHFSSRLGLDLCQDLLGSDPPEAEIRADVESRLASMQSLADWLAAANDATAPGDKFLRLNKGPFRLQATIDPLSEDSVDVLLAHTVLRTRVQHMEHLTKLALPLDSRRASLDALTGLKLFWQTPTGKAEKTGNTTLMFEIPSECEECEIGPGTFGTILTDGSADLVLDSTSWSQYRVQILPDKKGQDRTLCVRIGSKTWNAPAFRVLREKLAAVGDVGWVVDTVPSNINDERAADFLRSLTTGGETP